MTSKLYDYSKEQLQQLLDESTGYGEVLKKVGLGSKGSNPETLKRIIKELELDETKLNANRSKKFASCARKAHEKVRAPLQSLLTKNSHCQGHRLLQRLYEAGLKIPQCELCGIKD